MPPRRAARSSLVTAFVDPAPFSRAARAIGRAANGDALRQQLVDAARGALEPVRDKARQNIMGMRSAGLRKSGGPLRAAVARATIVEVRQQGELAGARVRAKKKPLPRGFTNAPKRLDTGSFRHPVFGNREVWARQRGERGWFSTPIESSTAKLRAAIQAVMETLSKTISQNME